MAGADRFREKCEQMLESSESIQLQAHAFLKLGMLREQGVGRAFLTNRRLIWLHMAPLPLLLLLPWLRRCVEIRVDQIGGLRHFRGSDFLEVTTADERYSFRLSERYLALWNPFSHSALAQTADEWDLKLKEFLSEANS